MKRTAILGIVVALAFATALPESEAWNPPMDPATEDFPPASLEPVSIESIAAALSNKVAEVVREDLTLASVRPDTNVTAVIRFVDNLGQQLFDIQGEGEQVLELNEAIVAVLDALKQRRIYKYQLWAEARLERVQEARKGQLSVADKLKLYLLLGEINASFISENMLNREIMSTMAAIYDELEPEGKKQARRLSIQQQADSLSDIGDLPRRMTPDDF